MASWIDLLSLTAVRLRILTLLMLFTTGLQTVAVIGGIIFAIRYVVQGIETSWTSTKESLKTKGLEVSPSGISVKTSRRFDHQDYMDATQRNLVKVVAASSFHKTTSTTTDSPPQLVPPKMGRTHSTSSSTTSHEKRKGIFRLRK